MATRCATTSSASALALKVLAQRAIWFRVPMSSPGALAFGVRPVQGRTRPTDRRTRSDSVNPAERAFACHSARSASLARIFTHTSRPAPLMCRCRWGVRGGTAPRQPLPGTREAWPQRVGWLPCAEPSRPPTRGALGRQNLHTRTLTKPLYAVSTTGEEAMSQGFQRRTRAGPGSASGRSSCSQGPEKEPRSRSGEVRAIRRSS